jgi:hypothetical protein
MARRASFCRVDLCASSLRAGSGSDFKIGNVRSISGVIAIYFDPALLLLTLLPIAPNHTAGYRKFLKLVGKCKYFCPL